jgi:hypothetical protein
LLSHGNDGRNGEERKIAEGEERIVAGVDDRQFFRLPNPYLGALDVDQPSELGALGQAMEDLILQIEDALVRGADFNQPVRCAVEGTVGGGDTIDCDHRNVRNRGQGRNDAAKFLDGFVGLGMLVDVVGEVALEAGMEERGPGFLARCAVEEFPGGGGFDVGLAEEFSQGCGSGGCHGLGMGRWSGLLPFYFTAT